MRALLRELFEFTFMENAKHIISRNEIWAKQWYIEHNADTRYELFQREAL